MVNILFLLLLVFFIQLSIGGGLYETLVVYPGWKNDVTPSTLLQKLNDSGQIRAAKAFWPIVSPAQILLSITNIILAWRFTGHAHSVWLAASVIILINRVITFSYFIPTMIRKFEHPEKTEAIQLKKSVRLWITLSPARIVIEFIGWCTAIWALMVLV